MMIGRFAIPRRSIRASMLRSGFERLPEFCWTRSAKGTNSYTCGSTRRRTSFNCHSEIMDFEHELEQLAKRYQEEGYGVVVHPQGDQLPPFAIDFGADIIAMRGGEKVLVQVKQDRTALEADPNVPVRAGITNSQPGWRYDLVILNEADPLRRWTRGSREPSNEEINEVLAYV